MRHISLLTKLRNKNSTETVLTTALGLTAGTEDNHDTPERVSREPDTPSAQTAVLTRTRESAIAFGKELIHALSADLRQGELSELAAIWELLPYHVSVVHVVNLALTNASSAMTPASPEQDPAVSQYFISSRFLTKCLIYL